MKSLLLPLDRAPRQAHTRDMNTTQTIQKRTSEISKGDVILTGGLRVWMRDEMRTDRSTEPVSYHGSGLVLNEEEARAAGFPVHQLHENVWNPGRGWGTDPIARWTIQGNDSATWTVEA